MCVYSAIVQQGIGTWGSPQHNNPWVYPPSFIPNTIPLPYKPTKEEIEKFRKLLESAREYDVVAGQPDCESDEKISAFKKIIDKIRAGAVAEGEQKIQKALDKLEKELAIND